VHPQIRSQDSSHGAARSEAAAMKDNVQWDRVHWVIEFEQELVENFQPPVARRVAHALGMSLYNPNEDPVESARAWLAAQRGHPDDSPKGRAK
jgi:hypothetical protein